MAFQVRKRDVIRLVQTACRTYRTTSQSTDIPTITVPHKMIKHIEKAKQKQLQKRIASKKKVMRSPVLIQCHRTEFNHHKGQTYSEFNPKCLASHGWTHYKSAGDSFTIDFKQENPSLEAEQEYKSSFEEFEVDDQLLSNLQRMNIESPTNIQSMVIPKILNGDCVVCAAETGSGKTLAYLLPVVEILNRQLSLSKDMDIPSNAPQCIVLLPTRELVKQVLKVAEQLTEETDISVSHHIGGSGTKSKLAYPKWAKTDILVTTPGILRKMLGRGIIKRGRLQHFIIDEADTLLDDSFSSEVLYVMRQLGIEGGSPSGDDTYVNTGVQITLASATLPRGLDNSIGSIIPVESFDKVTTDSLHRLMPHVPQIFMRVKPSQKAVEIVKLAKQNSSNSVPTMIFCNKSDTTFWLERLLQENNIKSLLMNSVISNDRRNQYYESFKDGECDILVCTDVGSRGLDTLRVQQVVNYDFPLYMSDYVHRAGRVGRVGSDKGCKVISYVTHKWDVALLWNIETAARKSTAFHNVNANIKKKIDSVVLQKYGGNYDL